MNMDLYGRNPKNEIGMDFRANIWSWRPIWDAINETGIIDQAMMDSMSFKDGAGPKDQETCDKLADALEEMIKDYSDSQSIHLAEFASETVRKIVREREKELAISMFCQKEEVLYATDGKHLREFIAFLRNCGGFEVC